MVIPHILQNSFGADRALRVGSIKTVQIVVSLNGRRRPSRRGQAVVAMGNLHGKILSLRHYYSVIHNAIKVAEKKWEGKVEINRSSLK